MYFACDSAHASAIHQALVEKISLHPDWTWLALVDGAFDFGGPSSRLAGKGAALYETDHLRDLVDASPCLHLLSGSDSAALQKEVVALVRHRRNRPMLSFVATTKNMHVLKDELASKSLVHTADGERYLLRFADTRVLPALAAAFAPSSWAWLTHSLRAWSYIDRGGALRDLPLAQEGITPPSTFSLSDKELAGLLEHGQPDAVIDVLAEKMPDLLPQSQHAEFYARIADTCTLARTHDVDAFPDVVALATLACVTDGAALTDPALHTLLRKREWESGKLIEKLMAWVE